MQLKDRIFIGQKKYVKRVTSCTNSGFHRAMVRGFVIASIYHNIMINLKCQVECADTHTQEGTIDYCKRYL